MRVVVASTGLQMGHPAGYANGSDPHSVPRGRVTLACPDQTTTVGPVSDAGPALFRVGDALDREPQLERYRAPNQYRFDRFDVAVPSKPPKHVKRPPRATGF